VHITLLKQGWEKTVEISGGIIGDNNYTYKRAFAYLAQVSRVLMPRITIGVNR
jgi:hypothetical protein